MQEACAVVATMCLEVGVVVVLTGRIGVYVGQSLVTLVAARMTNARHVQRNS